ncbi:MAG: GTPase ObgE [Patescibacteria group bacterium UBA2163]
MAFVDEITLKATAGKGGDGVVRWLRMRSKAFGGPAGGDGGRGGDVILRGVRDLNILSRYRGNPEFKAEDGGDGSKNELEGKNGVPVYIDVPVGSRIVETESGREWDIAVEGEEHTILKGGRGGYGNARFKSSTNQYPEKAIPGEYGESGTLEVEVRLIADVGFVGMPNAGKSTLLNAFTNRNAKVGAYPFTTLEPALGVLFGFVLADIPGLIEGAATGKGLGHAFLRHITRTRVLLHCVSVENEDVCATYTTIRNELSDYDKALLEKPEMVFLTKIDEVEEEVMKEKLKELEACSGSSVIPVSAIDDDRLKIAQDTLVKFLEKLEEEQKEKHHDTADSEDV